ncbi:hypothetical protein ACFOON_07075 [Novosphingobium piscinae]|uniref:Uncharacterized protein n=1 Tax=Novosphingobium piscinae TaxID=1507448 RepID=A0A7X1FX46_9SPHN|nr:hypothetical protein [Novosphingobium piscinae]MBC2668484.1 hypothetical protein [Novosphingobium piscinae]
MSESDEYPRGYGQIVETHLYFRNDFGYALVATFVPGHANSNLFEQLEYWQASVIEKASSGLSLKHAISSIVRHSSIEGDAPLSPQQAGFIEWVEGCESDEDILIDPSIVTHNSPVKFSDLVKAVNQSPASALIAINILSGGSQIDTLQWVICLGASRIFLRFVSGVEGIITQHFDEIRKSTLPNYTPRRSVSRYVELVGVASVTTSATGALSVAETPDGASIQSSAEKSS